MKTAGVTRPITGELHRNSASKPMSLPSPCTLGDKLSVVHHWRWIHSIECQFPDVLYLLKVTHPPECAMACFVVQ